MIKVSVTHRNGHISEMIVKGHAGSGEYGHDMVCAVVSGIVTGLANALDVMIHEEDIMLDEGICRIHISEPDSRSDDIMNTAVIMLKTVEEVNKKYLRITED